MGITGDWSEGDVRTLENAHFTEHSMSMSKVSRG